jgi:cAMP-dependent protein kinase regulator
VLFIVDSGQLDCYKKFKPNEDDKYLKTYYTGESFGELSLLYNVPRAASIVAKEDCVLWQLDRETFNAIVKDSAMKRRQRYEDFLKTVTILSSMDDYERSKIADIIKTITFKKGDYVIKQVEFSIKY